MKFKDTSGNASVTELSNYVSKSKLNINVPSFTSTNSRKGNDSIQLAERPSHSKGRVRPGTAVMK